MYKRTAKEKDSLHSVTLTMVILTLVLSVNSYADQYFQCNDMDHFTPEGQCSTRKAPPDARPGGSQGSGEENSGYTKEQLEMWAEPSVDASGKVTSKLPPLPAMRFMADPTPENAKAYVEWNRKRMEALEKAQQVLQATAGGGAPGAQEQRINNVRDIKSVEFFFSPT